MMLILEHKRPSWEVETIYFISLKIKKNTLDYPLKTLKPLILPPTKIKRLDVIFVVSNVVALT